MATKINDISTTLMTNMVSNMKEAKARKAEAAFQSFLDTAVNGEVSNDKIEDFDRLTAGSQETKYDSDNTYETNEMSGDQSVNTSKNDVRNPETQDENSVMSETDKANEVIDHVCEELGISREELFAQFEQLLDSIAAMLMEKFQVTEQELNSVLETLGLSLMDVFNQTDLMNVIVELTGVGDISAVLTDGDLYGQIQEVMAELNTLKDSVPLVENADMEQIQVLQQSMEAVMPTEVADDEETLMAKSDVVDLTADEANVTKQEPVLEIVSDKQDSNNMSDQGQQMTGNEAFQQFTGRVAQYAEQAMAAKGNEFAQQADMEAIIRQVTDYVKMQVNAETTSLEMQLYPESYGKLNLLVSVREGVVTAKLAVENEMVKSALEAQVVQLREDMSERGLKVDAVEVAIASHEFERNLEEGQGNNEEHQEENHTVRRQINLNDEGMTLEELAAMSEAEALTRKIMLENGNSIDFSA